ncbi:hypothetical protein AXF42_Ash005805 [Apostasia shenzhenica]|uniref:Uncharacterized protein n=1 Tax=Apostasia shenzhenica TaxID=1088818 RepID=A0A2I0BCF0_9ASPA|nr:hypothetical protein AXF42_Ash005805 [Apostasia shenzhenica]
MSAAICSCSISAAAAAAAADAASSRLSGSSVPRCLVSAVSSGGGGAGGSGTFYSRSSHGACSLVVRASAVHSFENSSDFVKRMEQAWLIYEQPRPIPCSSCQSKGHVECKWCGGTGFFIIGNNMLCEVPSRNTSCVICAGKGSVCCADCKGTGFRAKWLGKPPSS